MNIQRTIMKSNARMVLLSLLILFMVVSLIVGVISGVILNEANDDIRFNENLFEVQTYLRAIDNAEWSEHHGVLETMGFQLVVVQGEDIHYIKSGIDPPRSLNDISLTSVNLENAVYSLDSSVAVGRVITIDEIVYEVYAFDYAKIGFATLFQADFIYNLFRYLAVGILVIFFVYLLSRELSKRLVVRIMKPVNELMTGFRRIEEDDFSKNIDYVGEKEFEELCQSFNRMQTYLVDEKMKNTAYDKARTEMISGISHDLRTPLTAIKGFLKGMKDGVANSEEKRERYVDISYEKACDMDKLLQKLFYYAKLETKEMPFYFEKMDFGKIIDEFVMSKEDSLNAGISIHYELPNEVLWVDLDMDQFFRVFINIIENSTKYGGKEHVTIDIRVSALGDMVCLSIKDDGVGLSADKVDEVFQQFYRGDESRNSKIEGSGLGLYVAKQVVERHHGTIEAYGSDGFEVMIKLPKYKEI